MSINQTALEYLVVCSVNQGDEHRDNQNARAAVERTLREDRRLKGYQLEGVNITPELKNEAIRRVAAEWADTD